MDYLKAYNAGWQDARAESAKEIDELKSTIKTLLMAIEYIKYTEKPIYKIRMSEEKE